jgi:hypothetical protein
MVFKMISAFAEMAVVTQWYGATYFSMSRVPKNDFRVQLVVGVGVWTMRNLSNICINRWHMQDRRLT